MKPRRSHGPGIDGYTMIELVVVLTILGVLAATVGPRFFSQSTFNDRGYADELASALRATAQAAVASGCAARLTLTATGYSAAQQAASGNACNTSDTTWSTPVLSADGTALSDTAPSGESATPTGVYAFSDTGGLSSEPGTTITVGTRTISIDAVTGLVLVQ
jgi:MSHA pilin protein MshC